MGLFDRFSLKPKTHSERRTTLLKDVAGRTIAVKQRVELVQPRGMDLARNARRLVTYSDQEVTVWDLGTWRVLDNYSLAPRRIQHSIQGKVAISSDGGRLAIAITHPTNGQVLVIDTSTGRETLVEADDDTTVAFCGAGDKLAMGERWMYFSLLDLRSGHRTRIKTGDKGSGHGFEEDVHVVGSPDGRLVSTRTHEGVKVWDLNGTMLQFLPKQESDPGFSSDSTVIYSASRRHKIDSWDLNSKAQASHYPGVTGRDLGGVAPPRVAVSPDDQIVAAEAGSWLLVWNVQSWVEPPIKIWGGWPVFVDARTLVTLGYPKEGGYLKFLDVWELPL